MAVELCGGHPCNPSLGCVLVGEIAQQYQDALRRIANGKNPTSVAQGWARYRANAKEIIENGCERPNEPRAALAACPEALPESENGDNEMHNGF